MKTRAGAALQHAVLSASHNHDISRQRVLVVRTVETQIPRRGFKFHPRPFQAQKQDRCPTVPPHITHTTVLCCSLIPVSSSASKELQEHCQMGSSKATGGVSPQHTCHRLAFMFPHK